MQKRTAKVRLGAIPAILVQDVVVRMVCRVLLHLLSDVGSEFSDKLTA